MRAGLAATAWPACAGVRSVSPLASPGTDVVVDADFPGGNIVLERIAGDAVYLHQDLRDTQADWFYWYFRVRGARGRTLTFRFTRSDAIAARGPAVSTDGGAIWSWLSEPTADPREFRYRFAADANEVRFCLAMPYLEADLRRFLDRHASHPCLRRESLCHTQKGRDVERLVLGRQDGGAPHKVLLTARHHACEMMASHLLEGLMEGVLTDDEQGRWLRENVEFFVVPFVDKDGVEDGDQGKLRRPRDHNRDYDGVSLYPTVRALRETVPAWSAGKLRLALDLHCPALRGASHETIFFVGSPEPDNWQRAQQFAARLEAVQNGPLRYRTRDNLPFGTGWNTAKNKSDGKSFSRWAAEIPGVTGTTLELAYANANGQSVTIESASALGRDLARAIATHLT